MYKLSLTLCGILVLSASTVIAQEQAGAMALARAPEAATLMGRVNPAFWKTIELLDHGLPIPGAPQPSVVGARIRIVTAPIIEFAGVRIENRTITGRLLHTTEDTVTTNTGIGEADVILPRPRRTVVGTIAVLRPDTLVLRRDEGGVLTIPRAAIARLERQDGRRSRKRGAGLGLAIGGGAGAGIGYMIGRSCHSTAFLGCFMEPEASSVGGLIIGGVAGAVAGAFSGPRDRWRVVPLSWLNGGGI